MSSADFLAKLGIKYWRDFERRVVRDTHHLRCYNEMARPDLFQRTTDPITPSGEAVLEARLGDFGDRTYIQHLGFWLTKNVYIVASTYKTPKTSFEFCDVTLFRYCRGRMAKSGPRFEKIDQDHPEAAVCFKAAA